MDSIEDMFLKLLVRGMNPSGHFGASKGSLFYSRIIFRQKNRKPQHRAGFKTQGCHVSGQEGQPGWKGEMLSHLPNKVFCPAQLSSLPAAQDWRHQAAQKYQQSYSLAWKFPQMNHPKIPPTGSRVCHCITITFVNAQA